MITNDRQYKIAKSQCENFQYSLENFSINTAESKNIHPQLLAAQKSAIEYQLQNLMKEVKDYEDLKSGKIAISEVHSLNDIPLALIKARIANGLTQAELAEKVGVKMQQIQRYEAEQYDSASTKTLLKIANQLNITITGEAQIKDMDAPEIFDIKKYPFKQMFQRKWFGNFSGSYNDAVIDSKNLLEKYFEEVGGEKLHYSLTKKSVRSGATLNQFALNAWYAQVILKAKGQLLSKKFEKNIIDSVWLKNLAEMSADKEGPANAAKYLIESGIHFVIEPQLEGTYLDGAALLLEDMTPIIALTLRYDRLDNFWFVLFHEIAHIFLHLSDSLTAIFDDLDINIDGIEKEADVFALNALIPDDVWKKSLVRFSPSNETIINQSKALKINPALVAGRIRKETGKFHQFVNLIGQGQVKQNFLQELKN